eukprot:GDKI01002089.1.p1 GENE.GDKI01002089.1~~GDKI01002089.1.p1  ORF type:complete len:269 (-),score=86.72 GDKI01002089.1:23-769(-)
MGKKDGKKVAKKSPLEQQAEEANSIVCGSIFKLFPVFQSYTRNGLDAVLQCSAGKELSKDTMQQLFALTKSNMKTHYDAAKWDEKGWNDKDKMNEMTEPDARYLIARAASSEGEGEVLGFIHFRLCVEFEVFTCYIYELQTTEAARGKGLGKFMMQLLELVSRKFGAAQMMCTCFKSNTGAMSFYKSKLSYVMDENSPDKCWDPTEMYTYEILSKKLPPPQPIQKTESGLAASAVPVGPGGVGVVQGE